MTFRIKTRNDPNIAVILTVHDKGSYASNIGNLFGNIHVIRFVIPNTTIIGNAYEVKRQKVKELNR